MGCFCFGRDNRDGNDGSRAHDSPPRPISNSLNGSRDRRQRSSISAPIPGETIEIPEARGTSAPVPTAQPFFPRKIGLSLVPSPVLDDSSGKAYDLDVIAVHGLGGDPRKTWTYPKSECEDVFWLQDFLPRSLPGARIFTYGYDSNVYWSHSTGDIDDFANGLLAGLLLERSPAQSSRSIAFICHSMGGLVCKRSLVMANENTKRYGSILKSTGAIFFFGTPHHGSNTADIARYLFKFVPRNSRAIQMLNRGQPVRKDLLEDLNPQSKTLEKLCLSFVRRAHNVQCIITFYEVNKYCGEHIVPQASATIGVENETLIALSANHFDICRIKDEEELSYRQIVEACQMLGNHGELNLEEQQCLDSLALESFREPLSTRATPAKGTCEWILSIQQFNTWRDGLPPVVPVLWISGELGCGKTTLMTFLRDQMLGKSAVVDDAGQSFANRSIICSFFCDESNKDLANATVLLQGLVWDIVWQRHDLIRHALKYYGSYKSSRKWLYQDLWHIFRAVLDDPRTSGVCIMIDALDECEKKGRVKLLGDLGEYLNGRPKSRINLVLSSRPTTTGISPGLGAKFSRFKLDQDRDLRAHMATDIRRFVLDDLLSENQLSSHDDSDTSVELEALADTITTRSDGSFLWASLILREMEKRLIIRPADVEKFISKCPKDLYGLYCQPLKEVDADDRKDVVKSLHIMLAATRPLTLEEFGVAMAVGSKHQTWEALQQAGKEVFKPVASYLKKNLGDLVRISDKTITLRHHSVKDFLLNRLATPQDSQQTRTQELSDLSDAFPMSMNEAENTIAGCCISFLNMEVFAKKRSLRDVDREAWEDSGLGAISVWDDTTPNSPDSISLGFGREDRNPQRPFFEYAASNWGLHYASSEFAGEELTNAALKLSTGTNTLVNWSHHFRRSYRGCDNLPESLDALIVAAYFGQTTMVKKLTSNNDFNSSWSVGLTWASRMGHIDIVKILIELGISCMGEMVDRRSAFSWATAGGFLEIVITLLKYDGSSLINAKDEDRGCSPLMLAVEQGHPEVVQKLLDSENIDVNLRSNSGKTPIHSAIRGPDHSVTESKIFRTLLYDPRVDITVRDNRGRSVLSYAAEYGATEAIHELLGYQKRQDDIERLLDDKGDNEGLSPLSWAARMGFSDIIDLLCKTKKIGSQLRSVSNMDGANAFEVAAKHGRLEVIKALGQYYPDGVNSRDITLRTPLSVAMWENSAEVVHVLLDLGAKIDLGDEDGKPPISYGVGKIDLVRVLAERGADINLADNDGRTPLSYGCGIGNLKLVELLVKRGADINLADKKGHTPLWWARPMGGDLQAQLEGLGARL